MPDASTRSNLVPDASTCVLRHVLERRAVEHPDRAFLRVDDGRVISYGAFKTEVESTAAGLARLGVKWGDTVTVWLPNSVDMIRIWFAINWLGAVYVPINVSYRGNLLAHVVANAGSAVMVTSVDLVPRLADIDLAQLRSLVVLGGVADAPPSLVTYGPEALDGDPCDLPPLEQPIEPWHMQSVIYTSGTTGPSKGVASSYAHLYATTGPDSFYMLEESDCFLLNGPLFHVGGTLPVVAMLNRGGAVGVMGDFTTDTFWQTVRATNATFVTLLGVMTNFLAKRPPSAEDKEHTLRKVMMIPLAEDWRAFADRFGVTVWTLYNMTEISVPLVSEPNPPVPGTCGRLRKGIELRIVDENDCEKPDGEVGELIIRADAPWAMNSGYFRDDPATAAAWRNGWFHTGDAVFRDDAGNYFFADRLKDAIRRRGENISSFEVETEILAHHAIRECAVIPVPNEMSEDDVMAVIATTPGKSVSPEELLEFLRPRLAHFMLPRYIRILADLPRTTTHKVEKHRLRTSGVTDDTWDRDKAGIRISREKLRS